MNCCITFLKKKNRPCPHLMLQQKWSQILYRWLSQATCMNGNTSFRMCVTVKSYLILWWQPSLEFKHTWVSTDCNLPVDGHAFTYPNCDCLTSVWSVIFLSFGKHYSNLSRTIYLHKCNDLTYWCILVMVIILSYIKQTM